MKRKELIYSFIKVIKKLVKSILYELVRLSLYGESERRKEGESLRKVLIIRIDAIGDFIIFSPMLRYYRMLYPDSHITLLVNKMALDLAERFDEIDELIAFDRKRFNRDLIYTRGLLKKLKEKGFDVVIYPTYSREPSGDYIVKFLDASVKIGFDGDTCNISQKEKEKNNRYYTKLIPATPGVILEVERNKEFVEALGVNVDNYIPSFNPSEKDEIEARKLLSDNGLKDDKPFIVVCPGASFDKKIWPLERYAQLITLLKKEKDVEVVIIGSDNDSHLARKIKAITNASIVDITGKTTLITLSAILKMSILYIGSDTGSVHLAAAVGTPTVCIMGGGHFGRFFPYGDLKKNRIVYRYMDCFECNWQCIYPHKRGTPAPCISNIQVSDVIELLREVGIV